MLLDKRQIETAMSSASGKVLFTQFSRWHRGKIVAGTRVTAGHDQFEFFIGPDGKTVTDAIDRAHKFEEWDRTKAIKMNCDLETFLRNKFSTT